MKKTITINIGGIIFHIEEDGYEMLRSYLNDIGRYFSKFDGHIEIMEDIEARIAEILTDKLGAGKQAITLAEVMEVRAKMGEPSDFAEMESEEDEPVYSNTDRTTDTKAGMFEPEGRRLVRNGNRKMIAGVCAGIAHYLKVDALWVRLLFICLFFGFLFFPAVTGTVFILYVVLWIAMPESFDLQEDERIKKLYRDGSDDKVIGGVCSGIAAYFGVDVVAIRVLFVLLIFLFFTGVIAYIVLWAIMPEAVTMADRMKMKGEPVTLSNIERTIKHNFNINPKSESDMMRVLMLPFRGLAIIFNALGPILVMAAKVILGFFGVILIIMSLSLLVMTFTMLGTYVGIIPHDLVLHGMGNLPTNFWASTFPLWLVIFVFFTTLITALYLMLGGLKMIFHKLKVHPTLHIVGGGLYLVSFIGSGICIALFFNEYSNEYEFPEQQTLSLSAQVITLDANGHEDDALTHVTLTLQQAEGNEAILKKTYSARARNSDKAQSAVQFITYDMTMSDSSVMLPSQFEFAENAFFSMQDLHLTMYIPEGQKFKMRKGIADIIRNTITPAGYRVRDLGTNEWMFSNGNLTCITCPLGNLKSNRGNDAGERFGLQPITSITVIDNIWLRIALANDPVIETMDRHGMDIIEYHQREGNLHIQLKAKSSLDNGEKIKVMVHIPYLTSLEVGDNSFVDIQQMKLENLKLQMANKTRVQLDSDVKYLQVSAHDNASLRCYAKIGQLEADIMGNSEVDMLRANLDNAKVSSFDNAVVRLSVDNSAELHAAGNSLITYQKTSAKISAETTDNGRVLQE